MKGSSFFIKIKRVSSITHSYIFSFLWLLAQPFGYPISRLSDTCRHTRNTRYLASCIATGYKCDWIVKIVHRRGPPVLRFR